MVPVFEGRNDLLEVLTYVRASSGLEIIIKVVKDLCV